MKNIVYLVGILVMVTGTTAQAQGTESGYPDWAGTWHGQLTNWPARPNAKPVAVTMEIGAFPTEDETCTMWRTTYVEEDVVRQVKDYRLCRGSGEDDLFIDEGDGVTLTARWVGDVLITPFKYDEILLVVTTRLRGDVLEEEIITIDDKPAIDGVQPMAARGIQRLVLRRATSDSQ